MLCSHDLNPFDNSGNNRGQIGQVLLFKRCPSLRKEDLSKLHLQQRRSFRVRVILLQPRLDTFIVLMDYINLFSRHRLALLSLSSNMLSHLLIEIKILQSLGIFMEEYM